MGRPVGSRNKPKRALIALLEETYPGYHPVMEMVRIAKETTDASLEAQMHKEVAQYVVPKLKSVEVSGPDGKAIKVQSKILAILPVAVDA